LTFITDLDDLIRHRHGDVKKLREIRDTIRHDNFITTNDKNYVESLITMYLKNQAFVKPLPASNQIPKLNYNQNLLPVVQIQKVMSHLAFHLIKN